MYFLNCLIIFEVVVCQLDVTRDKSPHSHNPAHEIFDTVTATDAQAASEAKSFENCE